MTKSENIKAIEMHGCIVLARTFNLFAVCTPDRRPADFTVISPGGHRVPDLQRSLVAYDTHKTEEIETAFKQWQFRNGKESGNY